MTSATPDVDPNLHDVNLYIKPGHKRAPFFRYIRINLPRLTRALIVALIALLGACALVVARSGFNLFAGASAALVLLAVLAGVFVLCGLIPSIRPWDFGLVPAIGALIMYAAGLLGTAPFVWNGADVYLAAGWNTMMFSALGYLVLYWALNYKVIVAYPDDQGFED